MATAWTAGAPASACARGGTYERHRPEDTVLYQTLHEHWRTFLAEVSGESGAELPRFVTEGVEAFLRRCGILAHGFLRVVCDECRENRLVAFSCKRRGFCSSCLGRRMCDFAAHLRDHVMPRAPVRQWVLTVPHGLRFRMAFNPDVTGTVLRTFVSVVSRWLRRRARAVGIRELLKTGGVTVIQRFGSALNLNIHFHTLMIDGVYELRLGGPPIFHPVPAPTDDEVAAIARGGATEGGREGRSSRCRGRRCRRGPRAPARGPRRRVGGGRRRDRGPARRAHRAQRLAGPDGRDDRRGPPLRPGQWLQPPRQRPHRGQRSRRAGARGALFGAPADVAADRLTALPDGNVALRLKRRWSDGTEALIFTPAELIAKLLPLIPRPRKHVIRFHGVLAPAAAARSGIVPQPKAAEPSKPTAPPGTAYRLPWANLLRRVFLVDALDCPRCHGRMRIVAAVMEAMAVERILRHVGHEPRAPTLTPARAPPERDLVVDEPPGDFVTDPPVPEDFSD